MPPFRVRISKFVNPVLTEYTVGQNQTMRFPVYGAVVMWEGPISGHFDGFSVQLSPPDGIVRLPITLQGNLLFIFRGKSEQLSLLNNRNVIRKS